MMEEWRQVKGNARYEVSNEGRVRCAETGKLLSTKHADKIHGYCRVTLRDIGGNYVTKTVHRIVAEAFIPNPERKEQIHHKNRDKTDNRSVNLEWVTPDEHGKLDARPRAETAYFKNLRERQKKSTNVQS